MVDCFIRAAAEVCINNQSSEQPKQRNNLTSKPTVSMPDKSTIFHIPRTPACLPLSLVICVMKQPIDSSKYMKALVLVRLPSAIMWQTRASLLRSSRGCFFGVSPCSRLSSNYKISTRGWEHKYGSWPDAAGIGRKRLPGGAPLPKALSPKPAAEGTPPKPVHPSPPAPELSPTGAGASGRM